MVDRPVDLDELPGAGAAVQPVDVLGDDGVEDARAARARPAPRARRSGSLSRSALEAVAVEVPEALGVAPEHVDVRDLHRVDVLPQPGAGRAEVGDPGRHRDPRAGQGDDGVGLADELRELARPPRLSYLPCHLRRPLARGRRRCPPARRLGPERGDERVLLGLDALVEVALGRDGLDLLRSRPAPARPILRAHASGGVEQLVVGHDLVDQAELVGLVGEDRVAGEVHLERLARRRPGAAGAACRRSPG